MFKTKLGQIQNSLHQSVWIWRENGKVFVDGGGGKAEIIERILVTNGIIYTIDRVMIFQESNLNFSF